MRLSIREEAFVSLRTGKSPSSNHQRRWELVTLPDKKIILDLAKFIRPYPCRVQEAKTPQQEMFKIAYPRQFTMLVDCPYVIVPLFKCARLNAEWVSKLNPLTTAWCVAENIMLAAINEGLGYSLRIPLNREHDVVLNALGVPKGWMTPCFIGVSYPKEDEAVPEQYSTSPEGHIHLGGW